MKTLQPIQANVYCYFMHDYLRKSQPTAEECYQRLVARGKKEGWQVPTFEEMLEWLNRTFDQKKKDTLL
ncbi:DNA-binding domain-containing protein [Actinobacillus capsulatus]|uniref:DNA-binding domain-containing protein n=1 Tax=Actinobacillus capsulatus TaxID=717 RepID=UPI0003792161|nr:DNA-binding domain-containing protein [Actinobacillus capsulatus]